MHIFYKKDIVDLDTDELYLRRWAMKLPFGYSVKLHHIVRPDGDRCEHDHPWSFITFVLYGGYKEYVNGKLKELKPFHVGYRKAEYQHQI